MARKRTKRKKVTQTARAKRGTGKSAKTLGKPASTSSHGKRAVPTTNGSSRAIDLLRSWSPSRYSTR